jgi:hypothetical protein
MLRRSDAGTWVPTSQAAFGEGPSSGITEGERRLMTAVLVNALRSLFNDAERPGRGAARRLQQDLRWLTSADRDDLFSFEHICESLALDAERVRQHALAKLGAVTRLLGDPSSASRGRHQTGASFFFASTAAVG